MTKQQTREELRRRFTDSNFVTMATSRAMYAAVLDHKIAGNPIATGLNGKVVIVQPEDIVIDGEDEATSQDVKANAK